MMVGELSQNTGMMGLRLFVATFLLLVKGMKWMKCGICGQENINNTNFAAIEAAAMKTLNKMKM